ncbi:MAG: histidine--tRNA ligase, partial [Candidatus Aenigmarchaeota archaeon]|nr:histidine--tRNA ligase [Candidatus Aenigmarchaeota archaeon]
PVPGTRDFLPEDMILREKIIEKIKSVFRLYGFDPIETPVFEKLEILEGKYGEEERLIYKFEDLGGRKLGLRYDLTVPLARIISRFPGIPKPFKRYHISRVWRFDRPQKGRYREFWQCDVDIVGSKEIIADAEVIRVAYVALKKIGMDNFFFRVNNRKILTAFAKSLGLDESKSVEMFRSVDKLDKIGKNGVKKELFKKGFDENTIGQVMEFISIEGSNEEKIEKIRKMLSGYSEAIDGLNELQQLIKYAEYFGVESKLIVFDTSLVRGLDYYTGNVFEIWSKEFSRAIGGGGRYDKLIGMFSSQDIPAVGISLGIDPIIDLMKDNNLIDTEKTYAKVFVAFTDFDDKIVKYGLKIAEELRNDGIPTKVNLTKRRISKQLEYADKLNIPFVLIIGNNEVENSTVQLKLMKERKQITLNKNEITDKIKGILMNV